MIALQRVAAPLGGRAFRLLWLGQSISALGTALQLIAVIWLVQERTDSAVAVAGVALSTLLPRIAFALLGGVVADRFSATGVMVWADTARALSVFLLVGLLVLDIFSLPLLYALLIANAAAAALFDPAAASIVPRLVPAEQLQAANSVNRLTPQLAAVLGAPLAGALVAVTGPVPALTFNAASFAVAAACTALIPAGPSPTPSAARSSLLGDARAGLSYVTRHTWLWTLLVVDGLLGMAVGGPLTVALPVLADRTFDAGAAGFGWLFASYGAGALLGALLAGIVPPLRRRGVIYCVSGLAQAPLICTIALAPFPTALVALGIVGLLNGFVEILFLGLLQERVRGELLGRVMSIAALTAFGLQPLSQLLSGIIAERSGPAILFIGAGSLLGFGALAGLAIPALRRID